MVLFCRLWPRGTAGAYLWGYCGGQLGKEVGEAAGLLRADESRGILCTYRTQGPGKEGPGKEGPGKENAVWGVRTSRV